MAITVNTRANPVRRDVGQVASEATVINSGLTGQVIRYQISRRESTDVMNFFSNVNYANCSQVVSITSATLRVILPFSTEMRVRVKRNAEAWSDWFQFKTRDKDYKIPAATSDDSRIQDPTLKENRTITVTNTAPATVTYNRRGAVVTNSEHGYVSTTRVAYNSRGATVTNVD